MQNFSSFAQFGLGRVDGAWWSKSDISSYSWRIFANCYASKYLFFCRRSFSPNGLIKRFLSSFQHLVKKLVGLISVDVDEERQYNSAQALSDIVRLSREQMSQLQVGSLLRTPRPVL